MASSETKTRPATVVLLVLLAGAVIGWFVAGRFWPGHSLWGVVEVPRAGDLAAAPGAPGAPGLAIGLPPVREPAGKPAAPASAPEVPAVQSAGSHEGKPGVAAPGVAAPSDSAASVPASGVPASGVPASGVQASGVPGAQSSPAGAGPRFDEVRVGPQGTAIIAGRAAPGSDVVVKDGDKEIARTRADGQGAFVALPSEPLKPGGRELTLASRGAGEAEVKGDGSVLLMVPPPPVGAAAAAPAMAVVVPDTAAPRVLQGPGQAPQQDGPQPAAGAPAGAVSLDRVDYDEKGAIRFTGGAAPGVAIRLYVDNGPVGDTQAGAGGRWSLTPSGVVTPGVHSLRVDVVDAAGRVTGRVELPFQRETVRPAVVAGAGDQVVVQPGQSLWRLARAAYGSGVQYSVIYLANRDQIRDPRLIYPGQTFSVPARKP